MITINKKIFLFLIKLLLCFILSLVIIFSKRWIFYCSDSENETIESFYQPLLCNNYITLVGGDDLILFDTGSSDTGVFSDSVPNNSVFMVPYITNFRAIDSLSYDNGYILSPFIAGRMETNKVFIIYRKPINIPLDSKLVFNNSKRFVVIGMDLIQRGNWFLNFEDLDKAEIFCYPLDCPFSDLKLEKPDLVIDYNLYFLSRNSKANLIINGVLINDVVIDTGCGIDDLHLLLSEKVFDKLRLKENSINDCIINGIEYKQLKIGKAKNNYLATKFFFEKNKYFFIDSKAKKFYFWKRDDFSL